MCVLKITPYHVLLTVSLLDMLAAGLVMPQIKNHAIFSLGASHISIGLMGAFFSVSQLISEPVIGSLGDLKGRKPMFMLCLSVCSISYFYLGITSSLLVFIFLRIILGLAKHTQLLTKAITPDYVKDKTNQTVYYSRLAAMAGLGLTLGPILGGYIADFYPYYGFTIITITVGIILLFNLVIISCLPNKKPVKKDDNTSKTKAAKLITLIITPLKESIEELFKIDWTVFGDIFLYKLLLTLCFETFLENLGLFLITEHQISRKNLGFIYSIQSVTGSMCNYNIGYITHSYKNDKDFSQRNLHVFFGVTLCLMCLALAPNMYVFTLLLIPFSAAVTVGRMVSLEMLTNRSSNDRRGTVLGVANSIRSLVRIFTSLFSGLVNQYLGVKYEFFIAASFAGVGVVISYRDRSKSLKDKLK